MAQAEQTYVLQEKLLSLGGDLYVTDPDGNHVFEVDGKVFSVRRTLSVNDLQGRQLYEINASLMHIRKTFEIKRDGQVVATIQRALITFLRPRYSVALADGQSLEIKGNILDREFQASENGRPVFTASRRWLSFRDAYGIRVAPGFDAPFAIALAIALEQMELEHRRQGEHAGGGLSMGGL